MHEQCNKDRSNIALESEMPLDVQAVTLSVAICILGNRELNIAELGLEI